MRDSFRLWLVLLLWPVGAVPALRAHPYFLVCTCVKLCGSLQLVQLLLLTDGPAFAGPDMLYTLTAACMLCCGCSL
jgi:hypothetical protein